MSIFDVSIGALDGGPANLAQYRGRPMLVVNVASKCGLTPQYASLQQLYDTYAARGLVVIGVPCNQFGGQEPGTSLQIRDFCEANFGITFPITQKVDVNGEDRHELFARLVPTPDVDGIAGDIRWNFEKFLVAPSGEVVARFRPLTEPLAPELVAVVEKHLPATPPAALPVAPVTAPEPPAPSWSLGSLWPAARSWLPRTSGKPGTTTPLPAPRPDGSHR